MEVDLEQFRLTDRSAIPCLASPERKKRVRRFGLNGFVRGPIPLGWIATAAKLPGKSLHVGLAVWLLAGLEQGDVVKLTAKAINTFGVSRESLRRSLRALEQAGLVSVARRHGRCPVVTILDQEGQA